MKKALLILALTTFLTASLCACNNSDEVVDLDRESDTVAATEAPTEAPTETPTEAEETVKYWQVKCRAIKGYEEQYFAMSEADERELMINLPADWSFKKTDGGYIISRDGQEIGQISTESLVDRAWDPVADYSRAQGNELKIEKNIESMGSGADVKYRYRFKFNYEEAGDKREYSLAINYEELDANAADKIYHNAALTSATTVVSGSLADCADEDYLILGNSFIGTSNIGEIINEMFLSNDKYCHFRAISRGYASVATYIADPELMSEIESGNFKAVFICGFYADGEAENLAVLEQVCNKSGTKLIIFPAHNEFDGPISLAQLRCPDLMTLNWRGELDLLINNGVDKWDLCYDDQHLHSTEYAGLIGAMMIYRSMYSEMPDLSNMWSIDISRAREIFGSYLETGKIERTYEIKYLG